MNEFKYKVSLTITVQAFDESDAWDAVQDAFGIGDNAGIRVDTCEYKEIKTKK